MKFEICTVYAQIYIFPYLKITYSRLLNGNLEIIIGWINKELIIKF